MTGIVESIKIARNELEGKARGLGGVKRDVEGLGRSESDLTSKVDRLGASANRREVLDIERERRKESRSFRAESIGQLQRPLRTIAGLSRPCGEAVRS